jgi:hypothetical protein
MNGSVRMLAGLTMSERVPYMIDHGADIQKIVSTIPVLSIATIDPKKFGQIESATVLGIFRDVLAKIGFPSDGVVPLQSAILPGTDFVKLSGLDHLTTIGYSPFTPFDRVAFNRAILSMILAR